MKNNDAKLIQRVLEGDDAAFSTLVQKYQKSIHALAWRKTGDFHIAEDITQDTFLKAYQELSTLNEPQRFASWLYVIASNYCKMWFRKKHFSTESLENISSVQLEKATYSEFVIEEKERSAEETQREVVKKLLAKLQESERTVMTLYYLGGMTHEEISEFLGVSVAAIKNRLYRARNRLKKEETMIREALEHFQISPNLTDNIMKEISRTKQMTPSGSKPFIPWIVGVTAVTIVLLMLGFSNQFLSRFQKPYNFNAASDMRVELIDTPIVQNLESDPDDQTQFGNVNAQGENIEVGQQTDSIASLDLDTIISKIKHNDNAVTSVTGDFVREHHQGDNKKGIGRTEFTLTFEDKKIKVEGQEGFASILYWDGERTWEGTNSRNLIFAFEIAPDKEKTDLEMIQHAFKQQGIELTDDVSIVAGDEPESFTLIENKTDKTYYFWLEGETTLLVYDHQLEYSTRPQWMIFSDYDPRYWLTFAIVSGNSYLSEPLWHLLEKHDSKIIGNEILNGEKTSVIRLTIPVSSNGDIKTPDKSYKLWISHDIGFRLVKSEETFTVENPTEWSSFKAGVTYIRTRKIDYHEYIPGVWFPKKIESSTAQKTSSEQQGGENIIYKAVLLTKQCRINTNVTELLSLGLHPATLVIDYADGRQKTIADVLNPKINDTWILLKNATLPDRKDASNQQIYKPTSIDLDTIIAKMKEYDDALLSATGKFVIEHHKETGIAKTEYALTIEGQKIRIQREWLPSPIVKDAPLVEQLLPDIELYDGNQRWDIYKYKKLLLSIEIVRNKEHSLLQTIKQTFKQQDIEIADDLHIIAENTPDSYTLVESNTGKTYSVILIGETTLKIYDLKHVEYAVRDYMAHQDRRLHDPIRHQWGMFSNLDPRYWLTYPSAGGITYLTEPLWQLLETHENQLLGSETLNGEETFVIRVNIPNQSLKLWISHEKGFRLVKMQRAFLIENPKGILELSFFQPGITYVETREIDYQEYSPDIWFPKKIERYYIPNAVDEPQLKEQVILKTVIHTKQCEINTDVPKLFRLDLPPDTPVFGLRMEKDTPKTEKINYLREEIFRTLKRRLDLRKLDNNLVEFDRENPNVSLLRNQVHKEKSKLLHVISSIISEYILYSKDPSVIESGGLFYDLMEQNGIHIQIGE